MESIGGVMVGMLVFCIIIVLIGWFFFDKNDWRGRF